jgi:hypothetical protein
LDIDPESLETGDFESRIELVVPYTEPELTREVLAKIPALTAGLHAYIRLVAVLAIPFPADFTCPGSHHTFLVNELIAVSSACSLAICPEVVMARSNEDGLQYALGTESTALVGSRKRLWRTAEEKLAQSLVEQGHRVALLHLEDSDA